MCLGIPGQVVELLPRERVTLGGRLRLDEAAIDRRHDVHVGGCLRVLGIVERPHGQAVAAAARLAAQSAAKAMVGDLAS